MKISQTNKAYYFKWKSRKWKWNRNKWIMNKEESIKNMNGESYKWIMQKR